jgi:hypothetical protein
MSKESNISYLEAVLEKYKIHSFNVFKVKNKVSQLMKEFAGSDLSDLIEMGSFVQGTAVRKGTDTDVDLDLLLSINHQSTHTLPEIHDLLFKFLKKKNLKPLKRNISIRITVDKINVDLVPALTIPASDNHIVWSRKADIEMISNPGLHIKIIKRSGHKDTIKLVKLWIHQYNLELESFLAALCVVEALKDKESNDLGNNFKTALRYFATKYRYINMVDPANAKDSLSRHHTEEERKEVADLAKKHLSKNLDEILK